MIGKLYLVGAGPGDPKLITLKGVEVLKKADVVIYDRLVPEELLGYAKKESELIYAGKAPGRHFMEQEEINEKILEECRKGKVVVRLKGGDPYFFGRGEEECKFAISHNIPCEVVPGIPSFIAASSYSGIPLTNRRLSSSVSIVTGREAKEKKKPRVRIEEISSASDTLVILMGISNIKEILKRVSDIRGSDEPCAIITDATLPTQKTIVGSIDNVLKRIDEEEIKNPAVIIIGKTVRMREYLWKKA